MVALESLALFVQLAPDTAVGDANDEYGQDVLYQHRRVAVDEPIGRVLARPVLHTVEDLVSLGHVHFEITVVWHSGIQRWQIPYKTQ